MPKINAGDTKKLLIKYLLKVIITSTVTITGLTAVFSLIIFKADIDLSAAEYFSVVAIVIASFIVSYFCISDFKNNLLIMSLISVMPLCIYSIINMCVFSNNSVITLIKIVLILVIALISSLIKSKRTMR